MLGQINDLISSIYLQCTCTHSRILAVQVSRRSLQSRFTEFFYQASRDSRALKMIDHGVTKISLPPSLYLWFSEVVFFPFYCPDIVTATPCPRTLDETNFRDDDLIPKGLFTRRRGCPCARVTPERKLGVKVSSGLQANCTGRVILSPGSTLAASLTCFIMRDILCNGPRFEIILKFSMENTLNSRKKRKILSVYIENNFWFFRCL